MRGGSSSVIFVLIQLVKVYQMYKGINKAELILTDVIRMRVDSTSMPSKAVS